MKYARITIRPDQMGGVPCIRGLRIPVATVMDMVAQRIPEPEILAAYPDRPLTPDIVLDQVRRHPPTKPFTDQA